MMKSFSDDIQVILNSRTVAILGNTKVALKTSFLFYFFKSEKTFTTSIGSSIIYQIVNKTTIFINSLRTLVFFLITYRDT